MDHRLPWSGSRGRVPVVGFPSALGGPPPSDWRADVFFPLVTVITVAAIGFAGLMALGLRESADAGTGT